MISSALFIVAGAALPGLLFFWAISAWQANDRGMAIAVGVVGIATTGLLLGGVLASAGY